VNDGATFCPVCGAHDAYIRLPITDAVWGICRSHQLRWPREYRDPTWTPDLSGPNERVALERDWTLQQIWEARSAELAKYKIAPPPNRHFIEAPDRFALARWPRNADVATIARCILGTLKYEPHTTDTTPLRRVLEQLTKGHEQ
jgi:hypothetical protein